MSLPLVKLPYDPTARNPDNFVGGEAHDLTTTIGLPYKIITMNNGGFYSRTIRVYDEQYNALVFNQDYIVTYVYTRTSELIGYNICSAIVFLDKQRSGRVYVSAQMVGGDVAFSLSVINDYVKFYISQPEGYIPQLYDYAGDEPEWLPGELDKERWALDTYQPYNNEIYRFSRNIIAGAGLFEQDFRDKVKANYESYLDGLNNQLSIHVADMNNPHRDNTYAVQLDLVQNYKVATEAEALSDTANNLYLTPYLTSLIVNDKALTPLNNHLTDFNNPHRVTPELINAPKKTEVDATANTKYGKDDTVVDSNLLVDGATTYTYNQFYAYVRKDIPAGNFAYGGTNGYLDPRRIGNGTPAAMTVLTGELFWTPWSTILAQYGNKTAGKVLVLNNINPNTTPENAHQIAINQPWARTAPVNSTIYYYLNQTHQWGNGNGITTTTTRMLFGSYKRSTGWVRI